MDSLVVASAIIQAVSSGVLAAAGIGKMRNPEAGARYFRELRLPIGGAFGVWCVAAVELALAVAVAVASPAVAGVLVALTWAVFLAVVVGGMRNGVEGCACTGTRSDARHSWLLGSRGAGIVAGAGLAGYGIAGSGRDPAWPLAAVGAVLVTTTLMVIRVLPARERPAPSPEKSAQGTSRRGFIVGSAGVAAGLLAMVSNLSPAAALPTVDPCQKCYNDYNSHVEGCEEDYNLCLDGPGCVNTAACYKAYKNCLAKAESTFNSCKTAHCGS